MEWVHSHTANDEVTAIHCDKYYNRGTCSGIDIIIENTCSTLSDCPGKVLQEEQEFARQANHPL